MQDYPKLLHTIKSNHNYNYNHNHNLDMDDNHLVLTYPRYMAWSPVKNSLERGVEAEKKTGHAESAASGERDLLDLYKILLTSANTCPVCNPTKEVRVTIEEGGYVILWPTAGATTEELHRHLGTNVVVKKGGVLIVKARNWYLDDVVIEGTLILEDIDPTAEEQGTIELHHCHVKNEGWRYQSIDPVDPSISPIYAMRGYIVERKGQWICTCKCGQDRAERDALLGE